MTNFEEIYNNYFDDVYKFTFSLCGNQDLASEVTQETFFKALKSIHSFNGSCKLSVWLCQIAKNTLYSHYEKDKRLNYEVCIDELKEPYGFEKKLVNRDTSFEIHKLIHKLEEPYKEVFSLRTFGELSFSQIGELFGKTEGWGRVTYHRAKKQLRESLI